MDIFSTISSITFLNPWVLSGLTGLPILWWFLRITPPPPKHIAFPAIMLLSGLLNKDQTPDKAPWWLIAIRLLLVAMVILAFSHPTLRQEQSLNGQGPVVFVVENNWAAAPNWTEKKETVKDLLHEAEQQNRLVYIAMTAIDHIDQTQLLFGPMTTQAAQQRMAGLSPSPIKSNASSLLAQLEKEQWNSPPTIVWISNGVETKDSAALASQLPNIGHVYLRQGPASDFPVLLNLEKQSQARPSGVLLHIKRASLSQLENRPTQMALLLPKQSYQLLATGIDGRLLAKQPVTLEQGESKKSVPLNLPDSIMSEVARVSIEGQQHAGATYLLDDRWRNAKIGVIQPDGEEGLPLLSETFFLDKATEELGAISIAPLNILLRMQMGVLLLPDSALLSETDTNQLRNWVEQGGVLIRFAGPNLANQTDQEDPLLAVRIRYGGRAMDGMLQWDKPAKLEKFHENSPLANLTIPKDVIIKRQVLAENSSELSRSRWASLADGTSLISGRQLNKGWLVLFHSTANTSWSNLALSGSFPAILKRLSGLAFASSGENSVVDESNHITLPALKVLNGFGVLSTPENQINNLDLTDQKNLPTHLTPPGLYGRAGETRALNMSPTIGSFEFLPPFNDKVTILKRDIARSYDFKPTFLLTAFILLILDGILSLGLRGQLPQLANLRNAAKFPIYFLTLSFGFFSLLPSSGMAQSIVSAPVTPPQVSIINATGLAYVKTGNQKIDKISQEGLSGLAFILNQRTAVEVSEPSVIDVEKSELSFYPFLYWPISSSQPNLSRTAIENINEYLSFGGSILFDLRSQSSGGNPGRGIAQAHRRPQHS